MKKEKMPGFLRKICINLVLILCTVFGVSALSTQSVYAASMTCRPGYYAQQRDLTCSRPCPAGKYCTGGTFAVLPGDSNIGISGDVAIFGLRARGDLQCSSASHRLAAAFHIPRVGQLIAILIHRRRSQRDRLTHFAGSLISSNHDFWLL